MHTRPWSSGTNGLVAHTLTDKPCRADGMAKSAVLGIQQKTGAVLPRGYPRPPSGSMRPDRIGSDMELDLLKTVSRHTQGRHPPTPSHHPVKAAIHRMPSTRITLGGETRGCSLGRLRPTQSGREAVRLPVLVAWEAHQESSYTLFSRRQANAELSKQTVSYISRCPFFCFISCIG